MFDCYGVSYGFDWVGVVIDGGCVIDLVMYV